MFEDRSLSMLETIVLFLKKKGLKNKNIAAFLNRDPKTISCVVCRIKEKHSNISFEKDE
jgi:DNA-binding NarL/FixJ family response regulator